MKQVWKLMVRGNLLLTLLFAVSLSCTGCATEAADMLNPFAETPSEELGQRNDRALLMESGDGLEAEQARHSLEVMTKYRRAQEPQPYYPVVQPAEVRLMWVPDHLTRSGDLVPAHYYYLKVLDDRWAVQDSFDLHQQLESGTNEGGATPWIYKQGR